MLSILAHSFVMSSSGNSLLNAAPGRESHEADAPPLFFRNMFLYRLVEEYVFRINWSIGLGRFPARAEKDGQMKAIRRQTPCQDAQRHRDINSH